MIILPGGDARGGNTRSHPEHDGEDPRGRWYYAGDGMGEQAAARHFFEKAMREFARRADGAARWLFQMYTALHAMSGQERPEGRSRALMARKAPGRISYMRGPYLEN